jgi:hypothetical protein
MLILIHTTQYVKKIKSRSRVQKLIYFNTYQLIMSGLWNWCSLKKH